MHGEMNRYCATFHTHLAAILTHRTLTAAGVSARLSPVPRVLSSSCGTCVLYEAGEPMYGCMDCDTEAVYSAENGEYRLLKLLSE